MKLDAGTITINKPPEQVYSFLTKLENLEKQLPSSTIDGYEIEFDDDISGEIKVGTIIAIYLFSLSEEDEDKCFEFEVAEVEEYKTIKLKLVYIGRYDENKDDWSDPIPIESFVGVVGFEINLSPRNKMTQIRMTNTCNPKTKLIGIALKVVNFIGKLSNRRHYKEWARLVELHA